MYIWEEVYGGRVMRYSSSRVSLWFPSNQIRLDAMGADRRPLSPTRLHDHPGVANKLIPEMVSITPSKYITAASPVSPIRHEQCHQISSHPDVP